MLNWQDRVPLDLVPLPVCRAHHPPAGCGGLHHIQHQPGRAASHCLCGLGRVHRGHGRLWPGPAPHAGRAVQGGRALSEYGALAAVRRVCRFFREVAANWSVIRRPVLTFLLYLLMTVITIPTVVLVPVWQGVVLWLLCRWARQWRAVREGTGTHRGRRAGR